MATPTISSTAILFIDRNGFLLFSDTINRVLQFNFPPTIVRDLEIINQDQLNQQIYAFFTQSGLQPFQGIILLSDNLLFEKTFMSPQDENQQKELNSFLDNLPFEHVGSIIYTDKESKYITTNKDLYQGIIESFEKLNCSIEVVIPAWIIGVDINQMVSLNPQTAGGVYRSGMSVKQFSFLTGLPPKTQPRVSEKTEKKEQTEKPHEEAAEGKEEKEKNNTRVFLLVGVFVILLLVLGVVVYTTL